MRILAADDDEVNLTLLEQLLAPTGYELVVCGDGIDAEARVTEETFDLVLLDVGLPGLDGLELTRRFRRHPRTRDLPILLLTAQASRDDVARGFEAGASDYVAKPYHADELRHRIDVHLRARRNQLLLEEAVNRVNLQMLEVEAQRQRLADQEAEIQASNRLLAEANRRLLDSASRDLLTGLLNRRKGWDYLRYEEEKARRTGDPLGVALIDIDRFKSVNDTWGHEAGDRVLKALGRSLSSALRSSDILVRWGGEEFLAVFPGVDEDGLGVVAEKLREAVAQTEWPLPDRRRMTISVGTVVKRPDDEWDRTIAVADRALYRAKDAGRDRVVRARRTNR